MLGVVPAVLFCLETYHLLAHCLILFGIRTIPLKDLVKVSTYFLIDALTVLSSYLYCRQFFWLVLAQQIQHYYYVLNWNKSYYAKRVAFWSSLDWYTSGGKSQPVEWIGTAYDCLTHAAMMFSLSQFLGLYEFILGMVLVVVLAKMVLFNKKFAWSNPKDIPDWVNARCTATEATAY